MQLVSLLLSSHPTLEPCPPGLAPSVFRAFAYLWPVWLASGTSIKGLIPTTSASIPSASPPQSVCLAKKPLLALLPVPSHSLAEVGLPVNAIVASRLLLHTSCTSF